MAKYQNKYRIESARRPGFDYSSNGCYYITIITHERKCIFGNINDGIILLSPAGEVVMNEWNKSFEMRSDFFCDIYVIMPNHIHAIVRIEHLDCCSKKYPKNNNCLFRAPRSISSFVAGFKSAATKKINEQQETPGKEVWHPRFHDHIIRTEDEYLRIYNYIKNNPLTWV
jgi:putative transposase